VKPRSNNAELEWRSEMAIWLGEFSWDWFCSLSYRPYYSIPQRRALLRRWLKEVRSNYGTEYFGWFAVPERGRTGEDFHYHALVCGLQGLAAAHRFQFMKLWHALAGDALITEYNGDSGIVYILKNAGPNSMDEIEFDLNEACRMQTKFGRKEFNDRPPAEQGPNRGGHRKRWSD
jgi:hypothetical protein